MLLSASPRFPHSQITPSFHPSNLLHSVPAKDRGEIKNTQEKPQKSILKTPSSPIKDSSFFNQPPKDPNLGCSIQDPDTQSPSSSTAKRLVDEDPCTLSLLLKSCSSLKQVKCIHAVTLRLLDSSIPFVGNNLISSYIRFSNLVYARKLFDTMPDRDVVTWTAMLNGYLKLGPDDEVLSLFEESVENDIQANSFAYVCLLKLCGNWLDLELGRQIHAGIVKGRWNNLIVDSALLHFYARCGELFSASVVFDRMPVRDIVCWTTVITAYAQHSHGVKALLMFSQMQCDGFFPNERTVCSALKACAEEKSVRFGKQLHGTIAKGMFRVDVFVGSSLVSMYVSCGEVSDARLVFDLMPKRNTITWTSMVSGYAQNGLGEEALSLFQRMKRRRIFANNLTAVAVLSACGSICSLCLGKEVHGQIIKSSVKGNIHIGNTLIWFYCKCGEFAYAKRVLEAMPVRDVISWTALISGYTSLGHGSDALSFLKNMLLEGLQPNPFTYSSALKACAKLEALRYGQWIHASVSKSRALSNVFVDSALIGMYMKCGCIADASRIFDAMPQRNLVSWKTMITGYARNGLCSEALKLMYRMQAEGLYVDDFVLSSVLSSCGDFQWESECSFASSSQPDS